MIEIEKALRQAVDPFRLSSSLKNRHRPGWRFLLFTTKPSVIVFRPTWKVNVKRMVLTSSRKWGQPPAVVCSACCRCSLKSTSHLSPSATNYCSRTINFGQHRIILSANTASEVRQPPERCLSRQAGIVRYCLCFFYLYSQKGITG